MTAFVPTFLQRLRRHKGGRVLLIAALLIKIVAGTVCMLDGPRLASSPYSSGYTLSLATTQADTVSTGDDEGCLLGEGSDCHCACAHTAALPTAAPVLAIVIGPPDVVSHLPAAPRPLIARSPFRPPIA